MAEKEKKAWKKKHTMMVLAASLLVIIVGSLLLLWFLGDGGTPDVITGNPQTAVEHPIEIRPEMQNMAEPRTPEEVKTLEVPGFTDLQLIASVDLEIGLSIVRSGSYSGTFVEDGANADCSEVFALLVTNNSESFLELARLAIPVGEKTAYFDLTALPAGQSVLVMEKNGMICEGEAEYGTPVLVQYSMPDKDFSLHTDTFTITAADRVVNLTNVTPFDISGNIAIYYKNVSNGIYIGGITYSKTRENGVAANSVAQFICENYTVAGSEIIFIIYEQ